MANRALITGANGFLGRHLATHLRAKGLESATFKRDWFIDPGIEDIIKNIAPDYIFHLASAGNISGIHDDADIFTSNLGYLFNLLQAVKDIPLKGFINVSSSSVLLPYQTTYAATKLGAEALCKAYVDQYKLPIVTMRPFSLYGPGDHIGHLIPTIFRSCLYDEPMKIAKDPVHDWTYVDDFVKVMVDYAINAKKHQGKAIHVGSGHSTTNWWLLKEIEEIIGKQANIVGEFPDRSYDTDEWVAKSSLENVEFASTYLYIGLQKVFKSFTLQ